MGSYLYHAEQSADRPLVHYRRTSLAGSQRQTVLDLNDSAGPLYGCNILQMKMSPSHRHAAFVAEQGGQEVVTLLDVSSGELLVIC